MNVFLKMKNFGCLLLIAFFLNGCSENNKSESGNFAEFLGNEIIAFGGTSNSLPQKEINGLWAVRRDEFGAAINTKGIFFTEITNVLTQEFGPPRFYSPANESHGPTYLYHFSNVGVSVFVSSQTNGSEVILTRPLFKQ